MAQPTLDQLKKEIDSLTKQLGKTGINLINIKTLEEANTVLKGLKTEVSELTGNFGDLTTTLKNIVSEISRGDTATKDATKSYKGLVSIAQKMQYEEEGIYEYNVKQLKNLHEQAKTQLTNLKEAANRLSTTKNLTKEGRAILEALNDQFSIEESLLRGIEERLVLEKKVEKTVGATGALLETSNKLLGALGFGHLSSDIDELNKKLKDELRTEIENSSGKAANLGTAFKYMGKGISGMASILVRGLTDPLFIIGKIVTGFLDVNKAAVNYTRLSGINATNQAALNSRLATSVDYLETAAELTRQLGMSATSVFSNDDIAAMAEAKNLLGLSAEQAGALGIKSKLANTNIDAFQDNLLKGVSAGNQLNNSLVAPGVALQDVLDTSEDISMSLGNNPKALGKAAVAARAFGLDLAKVNDIASTLLQFEDSIGNELEAELMTGKNLNLEKAREYALTNNLEGLSRELAKNGATAAEFAKMNRLEQESLAKSLGMSREQLAKSVLAQEASKNATLAQRAAVMGVTKEQMQSMDIQERMAKTLDKLAQAFAPIFEALVPIVTIIGQAIQPIANLVGTLATGLGPFVGYLLTGYGILKGMQVTLTAISGLQAFITASKASELGLGLSLLANLGLRNAAEMYKLTLMEGGTVQAAIQAGLQQTILGSIIAQGIGVVRNIAVGAVALAQQIATAIAAVTTAQALTFGAATIGILAGLAAVAGVMYSTMKDGVIDPKKGPVVSGEFGSVQLHPNDQIVAGTDLMGAKKSQTISQAVNKTDTTQNEIKQMREENKTLLTALLNKTGDVYMDTNKVGKAQMLGNYKSS